MTDRNPPGKSDTHAETETVSGGGGLEGERRGRDSFKVTSKSVLIDLDPEGQYGGGVGLRELTEDPGLPKFRMGSEKYQVLKLLGAGGMGDVHLVYDRDLKRKVALKVSQGGNGSLHRRFIEEAQVMGQLQHPNILALHELGLSDNRKPYYTMPVVQGRTLESILDALEAGNSRIKGIYSLTRLIQVFLQVVQALGYAHAKGVIHRDIKPSNIMLWEHGEVQVLDWGLAKVVDKGKVKTDHESGLTRTGHVVGTPGYMAPEQARGDELDARTDIYALGVLLYEILTLQTPFKGPAVEILASILREDPVSPRARARDRDIPLALDRVCMKALRKSPEERQQSSQELYQEVQAWLEAEADRAERHERSEEMAREGKEKLTGYFDLKEEVKRFTAEALKLAKQFKGWQPESEKMPFIEAQDGLADSRRNLVRAASDVVTTLSAALGFENDNPSARGALSDYYWDRFEEAEDRGDWEDRDFYSELVANYDQGRYAERLQGDGTLMLESEPSGADVWLYEYVEEGFRLVPEKERLLGPTPLAPIPLPMGSYLLILKKEGFRDVRYPVSISRNREWKGTVTLATDEETGRGSVYVPAGPFIQGGDAETRGWDLPRSEPEVDGFFIGRDPVTMEEYLGFLNELAREDMKGAIRRSPRRHGEGGGYLTKASDGTLKLPEEDAAGNRWERRWPVFGISFFDAVAYCQWRSREERRTVRLPTETEWEKAARGVDGRWFPWGNRFDASLCNMRESRRERTAPVGIDGFPTDVSVYGIRGMAGNVRDWTATEWIEGEDARVARVVRGGAWGGTALGARCASRDKGGPSLVDSVLGFRVTRSA